MRILLVIPRVRIEYRPVPMLGIGYLSSMLKKEGKSVRLVDMRICEQTLSYLAKVISEYDPDIVGITSLTVGFNKAVQIAQYLKRRFQLRICIGGPHATMMKENLLERYSCFDFCVVGEGELTFTELCDRLEKEESSHGVEGLIFRDEGKIVVNPPRPPIENLNTLPYPDYDIFDKSTTMKPLLILTSRGCPYGCIFCSSGKIMGKKFRARSPKNIVEEMEFMIRKYGVRQFSIADDNFTFDKRRVYAICDEVIRRSLHIDIFCYNGIRVDRVDEGLLTKMKAAGVKSVGLGIESADEEVLKAIKKGISLDQVRRVIGWCRKLGIETIGFFLIGCPKDTITSTKKSIDFIRETRMDIAAFGMVVPYPGTELLDWIKQGNAKLLCSEDDLAELNPHSGNVWPAFETPEFTAKQRIKAYKHVLRETGFLRYKRTKGPISGRIVCFILLSVFGVKTLRGIAERIAEYRRWEGLLRVISEYYPTVEPPSKTEGPYCVQE